MTVTLNLPDDVAAELAARPDAEEFVAALVTDALMPSPKGPALASGAPLSIEDKIAAITADVPNEEWAKLPPDLSDHLDHYVYGTPKR